MKSFLTPFFLIAVLSAEPLGMVLEGIYSNASLMFRYKTNTIECAPYGVFTLTQVYNKKDLSQGCRVMIEKFFRSHPKVRYFSEYKLHYRQYYMIEPKKNGECIFNAKGRRSFSELLLLNGAAALQKGFKDDEYRHKFTQAQNSAHVNKKGIWSEPKLKKCLLEYMQ